MAKRNPSFKNDQLEFGFEIPDTARREGALLGIDRRIASGVSRMMADDGRSRFEIAGGVSALLNEDVSKAMLDAYASEARGDHNISAARLLALVAETGGYGVLNALLGEIGAALVVGEEIATVELGHIRAQKKILAQREAQLMKVVRPIASKGPKS